MARSHSVLTVIVMSAMLLAGTAYAQAPSPQPTPASPSIGERLKTKVEQKKDKLEAKLKTKVERKEDKLEAKWKRKSRNLLIVGSKPKTKTCTEQSALACCRFG